MNNDDFDRDRPALQLLGKEFIIVVVVVFSALSFTLGYFVGKSGIDKKSGNITQAAEITPLPPKQEIVTPPQPENTAVAENTLQSSEIAGDNIQPKKKEPFVIVEAKQPEPAKSLQQAKEKTPVQPLLKQTPKEPAEKPAVKESPASPPASAGKAKEGPVYTVQIGAFKSSSEAEIFRKKHTQKGLKPYITTSTNKKKEKIYKVRTGEFKEKKSAEVLSLKLNKTGKLKTFVTSKNG